MPWLMKAEPDSRVVKGKDVKFSVDDFEEIGISPWDGVRSHEAKKIMKEKMKLGDQVLFYHSNCKEPGVYALAEVAKEGYPDYTAWDPSHPYYDPKTKEEEPTWFMVSVKFLSRLAHPPSLALVKYLASCTTLPDTVGYIEKEGFEAVKNMQLVNRGRLSVQPVTEEAYEAIVSLGQKGGWEELVVKPGKKTKRKIEGDEGEVKPEIVKKEKADIEVKEKSTVKKGTPAVEGTRRSKRVKVER